MTSDSVRRMEARHAWPVRRYRLGTEPGDDLSATTTAEQRLAMVWTLTETAWSLTKAERPTYSRSTMPVRVVPLRAGSDAGQVA